MGVTILLETRKLKSVAARFPAEVDAIVRATALAIEGDAKQLAPVDTGNLRGSIKMVDAVPMDGKAEVVVGAEYGLYVERGTRYSRAQPFLGPAVQRHRAAFEAALAALLARLDN